MCSDGLVSVCVCVCLCVYSMCVMFSWVCVCDVLIRVCVMFSWVCVCVSGVIGWARIRFCSVMTLTAGWCWRMAPEIWWDTNTPVTDWTSAVTHVTVCVSARLSRYSARIERKRFPSSTSSPNPWWPVTSASTHAPGTPAAESACARRSWAARCQVTRVCVCVCVVCVCVCVCVSVCLSVSLCDAGIQTHTLTLNNTLSLFQTHTHTHTDTYAVLWSYWSDKPLIMYFKFKGQ